MTPMTLVLEDVVYFPTNVGKHFQVRANRLIGAGSQFTVETSDKATIKGTIEALRNTIGAHRMDDSVRMFHAPMSGSFVGKSHGLAFALAEFMISHAPVPRSARIDDRVAIFTPKELQVVATGVIERDGTILSDKTDFIIEKIEALLKTSAGASEDVIFGARRKLFILPKASNLPGSVGNVPASGNAPSDRADGLRRLRDAGWEVHEVRNIRELKFLYAPVAKRRQRPIRFGVLLGAVAAGIATLAGFALQNQKNPAAPMVTAAVPLGLDAPAVAQTPIPGSDGGPEVQPALDHANMGPQLAYRGHLTLEVARVKDGGSLGLVLAEAHRFVMDDRVALVLTHQNSDQNALVIIRGSGDRHDIPAVLLTPGTPVPIKSFDVRQLVGIGGDLTLFAVTCASDCLVEADVFHDWVKKSADIGVNGRTGSMDESAPLILNAELKLQEVL